MRGLLQLLAVYGGFLTFVLLLSISLALIVQYNHRQQEIALNSWGLFMAAAEQRINALAEYQGIKQELAQLQRKNKELEEQLNNIRYAKAWAADSTRLDSAALPFSFISATVISNSADREMDNSLRLNRGAVHGVRPNMGVIAADGSGLVGIVREVTPNYCRVMSVLHRQTRIKAAIKGSNYFGTLVWPGQDYRFMKLEAIPRHLNFDIGDTIITSGYSQIFPRGLLVGLIDSSKLGEGNYFHDIDVRLFNDLHNVRYVYIIENERWEEHQRLDQAEHE
jgi:rod shape-determining protein MreC